MGDAAHRFSLGLFPEHGFDELMNFLFLKRDKARLSQVVGFPSASNNNNADAVGLASGEHGDLVKHAFDGPPISSRRPCLVKQCIRLFIAPSAPGMGILLPCIFRRLHACILPFKNTACGRKSALALVTIVWTGAKNIIPFLDFPSNICF